MSREFFTENWSLKLFSLVLGLVIFFAVRTEQEVSTTVAVRLILKEPQGLINTADVPPEVTVRLSGPPSRIRALAPSELAPMTVDLSSFDRGFATVRIREEALDLPPELDVLSVSPSTIQLHFEPKERRKVPVRVAVQGKVAEGFVMGKTTVSPTEVHVVGPRREVSGVKYVRTAAVSVDGAKSDVSASVLFELPGPHARVEEVARAEVQVAVRPEQAERSVRLPLVGAPAGRPFFVEARLKGPKGVLEEIDEKALEAVLGPGGAFSPGAPVRIQNLPEGVELLHPLPTVPRAPGRVPVP